MLQSIKATCFVLTVVALAVFANETTPEDVLFEDARQSVQVLLQQGKANSACHSLAESEIKGVRDQVRDAQKIVDRTPDGSRCKHAGQEAVEAAKRREDGFVHHCIGSAERQKQPRMREFMSVPMR
jgi:hypothetical protein